MMERRPPKPASPESDLRDEHSENATEEEEVRSPGKSEESDKRKEPPLPSENTPPLPDEAPPLPNEAPPTEQTDDGWDPLWDDRAQAFYFYNRFTHMSQWENPRVPDSAQPGPPGVANHNRDAPPSQAPVAAYNPAIHGDYDPNADYAKPQQPLIPSIDGPTAPGTTTQGDPYAATGAFNRFTGKWQNAEFTTERFSDESKSKRQMNAFFDVDAAANSHDGRSLRAERQQKKLSKRELQTFKEKRREKKEEKRRAWLKD